MDTPSSEIDPAIYEKDNELAFSFALIDAAKTYTAAIETITTYEQEHSPEATTGITQELQDQPEFKQVMDIVGESLAGMVEELAVHRLQKTGGISETTYMTMLHEKIRSGDDLAAYVFGYQQYMNDHLLTAYEGDAEEAETSAWTAAWTKLRATIQPLGGVVLADVADFFDALIHIRYAENYDHTERLRGAVVAEDISARTFYETMEEHLARTIVRRRDKWSGQ